MRRELTSQNVAGVGYIYISAPDWAFVNGARKARSLEPACAQVQGNTFLGIEKTKLRNLARVSILHEKSHCRTVISHFVHHGVVLQYERIWFNLNTCRAPLSNDL